MSAISIFIEIDFEGNTYYLSNSAVTREQVFYPYLTSVPSLSIGGDGYAVVTTGGLSIIRSEDPTHPFSGDRYYSLIEKAQEIPFRIYIEDEDAPVFIGNIALDKVREDEFNFLILEEDFEKKLVTPVISKNSGSRRVDVWYLYREFGSSELRLMLAGLSIGEEFNNMDEVIIEKTYKHIGEKYEVTPFAQLIYNDFEDNRYFISDAKRVRVMIVDKDDNSKYITTNDLLNFYNDKNATLYFPTESDILTELGVDLNTPLTSSFTETYTDKDGNVHNTLNLQNPYNYLMFYDENNNEMGELFRISNQPTSEFWVGVPNPNPFTFGRIQMRDPVVVFGERNIKSTYLNYDPTPVDTTPVSASATGSYKSDFVLVNEVPGVQAVPSRNVRVTSANANQFSPVFVATQFTHDGRYKWFRAGDGSVTYFSYASGVTSESNAHPLQTGTQTGTSDSYSGPVTINSDKSNYGNFGGKYTQGGSGFTDRSVWFTAFNGGSYFVPNVSSGSLGVTRNYFYTRQGGGTTVTNPVPEGPRFDAQNYWEWGASTVSSWTGFEYADYPDYRWIRTYIKPHNGNSYYMLRWGTAYSGLVSSSTNKYWTGTSYTFGYQYERSTSVEKYEDWSPVPAFSDSYRVEVITDSINAGNRVRFFLGNSTSPVHWHWGTSTSANVNLFLNGFTITRLERYSTNVEGQSTSTGSSGITVTTKEYRIRYTARNSIRHHRVRRQTTTPSSTGTASFVWGGKTIGVNGVTANESSAISVTRNEGGKSVTYKKDGPYVTITGARRAPISRITAGSTTITPYTYSLVTDSWSKSAIWTYMDVYAWTEAVEGVPHVPEFTYEKSRERIYSRDNNLYQDAAWGVGWAKDRNFIGANSGYYLSQIIVSNGVVSESTETIKVSIHSSGLISGLENSPQKLKFNSITNALDTTTADPNDRISSDLYRVYRTDSKKEDEEVGILRIRSSKPQIVNTSSMVYVIHNLDLSYDSNPNSAVISFRCYSGTKVKAIGYEDNAGNSTGWVNENLVTSGYVDSFEREPIPSGTQKMTIIIDHDPDHTFDSYSNNNFGLDLEIHQRILPEIGSTIGFETIYALVGSFEIYISNPQAFYGHYDLIDYGFKQAADLEFDEVTGELGVNTIRNPGLNVNSLDFPVRIFDDGYPLSEDQVLLAYSDEEFINIKTNPFGQYAITGESIYGRTVGEFFQNVVCKKLNEEDEKVELTPDLTRAPYSSMNIEPFNNLPIFQDSEITVIEMAREVATNTNHIFFFKYLYDVGSGKLSRQLVLVDLNHVFNELSSDKNIAESQIVSIETDYPYPAKAFESTLTRNVSYIASDENSDLAKPTNMKSQSSKYRVEGSGVGKVQNVNVFAETFSEGRKWMRRLAETLQLPICSVRYEGIDREVNLGSKVFFTDYMRKLDIEVVIQSMNYDFDQETTSIEGIGKFNEITYRS